jgi:hypothetical protein
MNGVFAQTAVVNTAIGLHLSALQPRAALMIVMHPAGSKPPTSPRQLLHGTGMPSVVPSVTQCNGGMQVVRGIHFPADHGHKPGSMSAGFNPVQHMSGVSEATVSTEKPVNGHILIHLQL